MKFMTYKNEIYMVSEKLRAEIATVEVSRISYMNNFSLFTMSFQIFVRNIMLLKKSERDI